MADRLLTMAEIAELTRLPMGTLRWYCHRGTGGPKMFLVGRRVVARESEVLAWIQEQADAANDGRTAV